MIRLINEEPRYFIEILSYYELKQYLKEEILTKDDVVKDGSEYNDYKETRKSLTKHLKKTATEIRNNKYVSSAHVNPSTDESKPGLSNYINIEMNHPDGLTQDEIDKHYKYSLRYSDHGDHHAEKGKYPVEMVGHKVSELHDLGMKKFRNKFPTIRRDIIKFEKEKFGRSITFASQNQNNSTDNNMQTESIKLKIRE